MFSKITVETIKRYIPKIIESRNGVSKPCEAGEYFLVRLVKRRFGVFSNCEVIRRFNNAEEAEKFRLETEKLIDKYSKL